MLVLFALITSDEHATEYEANIITTFALLVAPTSFTTATFCFFSRPRSQSKARIIPISVPFVYGLAACLISTINDVDAITVAGVRSSSIFLLTSIGGVCLILISFNSQNYLRTFSDNQIQRYLLRFCTSVFPMIFVSCYLILEGISCAAHKTKRRADRCEGFVVCQYVLLINTTISFVSFALSSFLPLLPWSSVFLFTPPQENGEPVEGLQIYHIAVTITTSFLASITFGLRPEKEASSDSNYEAGAGIAAGIVSVFVWVILALWVSLITFYMAFVKLRILEEEDEEEDADEEEVGTPSFKADACKLLLSKLSTFNRLRQVKRERMPMSIIYRIGFSTMSVLNVLTAFLSIITHVLGEGDLTHINSSTGMFFLLMSEQLLPFGWVGSVLFTFSDYKSGTPSISRSESILTWAPSATSVCCLTFFWMQGRFYAGFIYVGITSASVTLGFACRRAKLSFLRKAGKEGCIEPNEHLVSTGVIGSAVLGPMVLVASQGISCLMTDFSGGRGEKELIYDDNSCDSIFTANRPLMLMFVYVTFQGVAFGWQRDMPTLEEIVRMKINKPQVIQGFAFAVGAIISLFLYSCGGNFGEKTKGYRTILVYVFCFTVMFSTSFQVIHRFRSKSKEKRKRKMKIGEEGEGERKRKESEPKGTEMESWGKKIKEMKKKSSGTSGQQVDEGIAGILGTLDPGFV